MSLIAANLQGVTRRINAAIAGRPASFIAPICLIAVSKTKPESAIREAFTAGQRHFGENYVQEALQKIVTTEDLYFNLNDRIVWHLIGPLQSNKAKLVANHFDWVHSIDRIKIAIALSTHRPLNLPPLNVLVQVNVSGESTKSGVSLDEAKVLISAVALLPRLRLRGLMTIVENIADEGQLRQQFAQMRRLFDEIKLHFPGIDTLSMGMSQDFPIAIDEGATMIRIGSAIFGTR